MVLTEEVVAELFLVTYLLMSILLPTSEVCVNAVFEYFKLCIKKKIWYLGALYWFGYFVMLL